MFANKIGKNLMGHKKKRVDELENEGHYFNFCPKFFGFIKLLIDVNSGMLFPLLKSDSKKLMNSNQLHQLKLRAFAFVWVLDFKLIILCLLLKKNDIINHKPAS